MNAQVNTDSLKNAAAVVSANSLTAVVARQRAAFLRDGAPTLASRKADLQKLKAAVRANLPKLADALDADFQGRSKSETTILEGMALVQGINYLSRNLK